MSCDTSTSSTNCSTSTIDAIREICDDCDRPDLTYISQPKRFNYVAGGCPEPPRRYEQGTCKFTSVIMPLSELIPGSSGAMGSVEFIMRRKNKTVTLQWEPFSGNLAANGVSYLTVAQTISNTPPYLISLPIYFKYKSIGRVTHAEIDPHAKSPVIKFYLNTDASSTATMMGDSISFPGGSISWIVD